MVAIHCTMYSCSHPYSGVHPGRERLSCDDDCSTIHISKVQALTDLYNENIILNTILNLKYSWDWVFSLVSTYLSSTDCKEGCTIVVWTDNFFIECIHCLKKKERVQLQGCVHRCICILYYGSLGWILIFSEVPRNWACTALFSVVYHYSEVYKRLM